MRADAKALGSWEKKKNSKCSPSVLKKKKMSGRKEVTSKDLLLLKISLYLKSPSGCEFLCCPTCGAFFD